MQFFPNFVTPISFFSFLVTWDHFLPFWFFLLQTDILELSWMLWILPLEHWTRGWKDTLILYRTISQTNRGRCPVGVRIMSQTARSPASSLQSPNFHLSIVRIRKRLNFLYLHCKAEKAAADETAFFPVWFCWWVFSFASVMLWLFYLFAQLGFG